MVSPLFVSTLLTCLVAAGLHPSHVEELSGSMIHEDLTDAISFATLYYRGRLYPEIPPKKMQRCVVAAKDAVMCRQVSDQEEVCILLDTALSNFDPRHRHCRAGPDSSWMCTAQTP